MADGAGEQQPPAGQPASGEWLHVAQLVMGRPHSADDMAWLQEAIQPLMQLIQRNGQLEAVLQAASPTELRCMLAGGLGLPGGSVAEAVRRVSSGQATQAHIAALQLLLDTLVLPQLHFARECPLLPCEDDQLLVLMLVCGTARDRAMRQALVEATHGASFLACVFDGLTSQEHRAVAVQLLRSTSARDTQGRAFVGACGGPAVLAAILAGPQHDALPVLEDAADALAWLTLDHSKAVLESGAVAPLVRAATSGATQRLREAALTALVNVARNRSDSHGEIAAAGGAAMLLRSSLGLSTAAWRSVRELQLVTRVLESLGLASPAGHPVAAALQLLRSSNDPRVKEGAVEFLRELAQLELQGAAPLPRARPPSQVAAAAGAAPVLTQLVLRGGSLAESAAAALHDLSLVWPQRCWSATEARGVSIGDLVQLLHAPGASLAVQHAAAAVLAAVVAINSERQRRQIAAAGGVQALAAVLARGAARVSSGGSSSSSDGGGSSDGMLQHSEVALLRCAAHVLRTLASNSSVHAAVCVTHGAVPSLVVLAGSSSPWLQCAATSVLVPLAATQGVPRTAVASPPALTALVQACSAGPWRHGLLDLAACLAARLLWWLPGRAGHALRGRAAAATAALEEQQLRCQQQKHAARALAGLASERSLRPQLLAAGAVPALVLVLGSGTPRAVVAACTALASLTSDCAPACEAMAAAGGDLLLRSLADLTFGWASDEQAVSVDAQRHDVMTLLDVKEAAARAYASFEASRLRPSAPAAAAAAAGADAAPRSAARQPGRRAAAAAARAPAAAAAPAPASAPAAGAPAGVRMRVPVLVEEDDDDDDDDEDECVVCMVAPRSLLFLPCRHFVVCGACWEALLCNVHAERGAGSAQCVICRAPVAKVRKHEPGKDAGRVFA